MRQVKFGTLISFSIRRTKLILFQPFSLKKWLLLLFIAYMAGAMGSGGNSAGGGNNKEKKAEAAIEDEVITDENLQALLEKYKGAQNIDEYDLILEDKDSSNEQPLNQTFLYKKISSKTASPPLSLKDTWQEKLKTLASGWGLAAIIVVSILILTLSVLFSWLSARFRFIWFDAIVKNDASIKEPFSRYKKEGNSLFIFFVVLGLVFLGLLALLILWGISSAKSAGAFEQGFNWGFSSILSIFGLPVLTFAILIILLITLGVCIDHFVVPIMAMESCTLSIGWKKFSEVFSQNKKDLFLYFLLLIALGIATAIIGFILVLLFLLVVLLAAAIVFGIPYLIIVLLLKAKAIFYILAIIAGIPFLIAMLLLFLSINLPFAVFFKCFSLYFLSSLSCGYAPLPLIETTEPKQNQPPI